MILGKEISDGRLDTVLAVLNSISDNKDKELVLNFSKTEKISPAGFAILACLFDYSIEQNCSINVINLDAQFTNFKVIKNLLGQFSYCKLPDVRIHDSDGDQFILRGRGPHIAGDLVNELENFYQSKISEDLMFSLQLLTNELMLNSVDHSTAERFYWYTGIWNEEIHLGLLDLGVTIPAKLEQKYSFDNDIHALNKAIKKGTTTRRSRPGGLGLYNTSLCLKESKGILVLISRRSSVRYYFRRRKEAKTILKHSLPGTWCFTRFPLK